MGSRCYRAFIYSDVDTEDRTWTGARTNCQLAGGGLVSINDAQEDANVNMVRRVSTGHDGLGWEAEIDSKLCRYSSAFIKV